MPLPALLLGVVKKANEISVIRAESGMLASVAQPVLGTPVDVSADRLIRMPQKATTLSWIDESARAAGCNVISLRPVDAATDFESAWTISVAGSYHCVGIFVESMEQSRHIVRVSRILSSVPQTGGSLVTEVSLSIWFVS